jgi:hypothetical protein
MTSSDFFNFWCDKLSYYEGWTPHGEGPTGAHLVAVPLTSLYIFYQMKYHFTGIVLLGATLQKIVCRIPGEDCII